MLRKEKSLAEIAKSKNYPFIEIRYRYQLEDGTKDDIFAGCCSYVDGNLKSLDGDTYSLNTVYVDWEKWENDDGETCLTVWREMNM